MEGTKFEDWLTAEEVATWLGVTKRVLSSARDLPAAVVGGRRFYAKPDVAAWLEKRRNRDA